MPKLPVLSGAEAASNEVSRRLAEFEAAAATELRSKLIDEQSSAFRWIVASLFALNGGAILALVGKAEFGLSPNLSAFWAFFIGILSTFLSVILAQISDRLRIEILFRSGQYWTKVAVAGVGDDVEENAIKKILARADRLGQRSRLIALFAMGFFVLGVLNAFVLKQGEAVAKLESSSDKLNAEIDAIGKRIHQLEVAPARK